MEPSIINSQNTNNQDSSTIKDAKVTSQPTAEIKFDELGTTIKKSIHHINSLKERVAELEEANMNYIAQIARLKEDFATEKEGLLQTIQSYHTRLKELRKQIPHIKKKKKGYGLFRCTH